MIQWCNRSLVQGSALMYFEISSIGSLIGAEHHREAIK